MSSQTSSPSPQASGPELSEEEQAKLEASRKLMNYLILSLGGGVVAFMLFGIYQLVVIVLENS